jgi:hypothetical protein
MAMKDAKIKYLEHELEEKERVLEQLREVDHAPTPVAEDGRIGTLERRVRELEAVVKGLTEEVLDLKALTLKLVKTAERSEGSATPAPERGERLPRHRRLRPRPRSWSARETRRNSLRCRPRHHVSRRPSIRRPQSPLRGWT